MIDPVQQNPRVVENAPPDGVEVRRIPRGVGDDRGSVHPPPPKKPGLFESGVHWVCFFLARIFLKVFRFFSPEQAQPPAPPPPPAPDPAVQQPREVDLLEGMPVKRRVYSLLQYCYSVQSDDRPPVDDPDLYIVYEALADSWQKKWNYQRLGKKNRWTLWETLTCWTEEAKLKRDVRAGKEYAQGTPSVLVDDDVPLLEKYCREYPQPPEQ